MMRQKYRSIILIIIVLLLHLLLLLMIFSCPTTGGDTLEYHDTKPTFSPQEKLSITKPNQTKVLIWAYARGGSSYFGEIFNENDDTFYFFEPAGMTFVALYGVYWTNRVIPWMQNSQPYVDIGSFGEDYLMNDTS